ncbi:MAG: amino acid ABC transporter permease [Anaerolineae bacterium]|nr:amino acid ABC transporter permease [Anaerolineae bacterium]
MQDESRLTEQPSPTEAPSPEDPPSDEFVPETSTADKIFNWLAGLPWWAIILAVVAVAVLYSMFTSAAYQNVIRFLTDDPQRSTDDLFDVVQIVGEPAMIIGHFTGETQDSVESVITELLTEVIDSSLVTRAGFIEKETPATITVQTDSGSVTIPKDRIKRMEPPDAAVGSDVEISYIDRVTVTGTLTERDDDTMTVRTVDEEIQTFATARILNEETSVIACDKNADPDCTDREVVTILREGEIVTGTLTTLSQTGVSLQLPDESTREFRRAEVEYIHVPTLTIALNEAQAEEPVAEGQEVRIGFVDGTDITAALEQLDQLEDIPVPLRYSEGSARVALVSYPDIKAALEATGAGDVAGLVYLDAGSERWAVADWVDANPDAGVVLASEPRECTRHCEITVKMNDDELTGTVTARSADEISIRTVDAEYVVIDRDKILDNRRMEPGVCALNNLRGCNEGIFLTLRVTFLAYGLALAIGLFVGLMRVSNNPVIYAISTLYVEVIRGIPLLVILLYAGFVISPWIRDHTPVELSDEWEAIIGLAFGYGAFIAEIFRAGIQSISRGQMEAARSLGMSYPQAMRHVILPQAVRVVLPPLGNDFIAMLKDSALISVLALPDLLQFGRLYISRTFRAFEGYNTVAILYLLMTLFLSLLVRLIERRSRLPQ